MIASENYTSPAVMAAQGSVLTNKYAEGYPGRRYYGGCEFVDVAERLAIERLLKLFGAERANVQPHSGAQANMAVYFACLEPGDTILAMDLAHGGHLTHGMQLNFSGKLYKVVSYGVRQDDERIDFDQVAKLAREHKPKLIVAGASAYPREIDFAQFARDLPRRSRRSSWSTWPTSPGWSRRSCIPSPVPFADFVDHDDAQDPARPARRRSSCASRTGARRSTRPSSPACRAGRSCTSSPPRRSPSARRCKPEFKTYAAQVIANAKTLAHELQRPGFRLVSGGTDNHLMLVDVAAQGLTGKIAEEALDEAGITVNKNMIPFDPRPPLDPSGIRIGTPALTTRGMREPEMRHHRRLDRRGAVGAGRQGGAGRVRGRVRELCQQFPAPANAE